jgi:hypothetical protein
MPSHNKVILTMPSSATVKLASGHQMPLVGFGLWKVPKGSAAETVYNVSCIFSRKRQAKMLSSAQYRVTWLTNIALGHQSRIPSL